MLKHNRRAIDRDGDASLVFMTRTGAAYYREDEIQKVVEVNGTKVRKLVGVKVSGPIQCTFGRIAGELGMQGVSFYRLRHTLRTLAAHAKDRETVNLIMGHRDASIGRLYDPSGVDWNRVRRVSIIAFRQLWPRVKRLDGKQG